MSNEIMVRPCKIKRMTFDAYKASNVKVLDRCVSSDPKHNHLVVQVTNADCDVLWEEHIWSGRLTATLQEVHTGISEALKAPVKLTDAVLEELYKHWMRNSLWENAEEYVVSRYSEYGNIENCKLKYWNGNWHYYAPHMRDVKYINKYADSISPICGESAFVLHKFYTSGVAHERKETKDV